MPAQPRPADGNAAEVLRAALRLGLTSFGGPIAHLGYFERVYNPVWVSAVRDGADIAIAAGALLLLQTQRVPPLAVVVSCAAASIARALA
jgi:hypothetical protein